jgi:y4mF family transcriptional regulator
MKEIQSIVALGQIIRGTRKTQGMTQAQLAAACGLGIRFIRELESGKESCHIGKALLVVTMLGLKLALITREEIKR